jgi:hypothetical protein
MILQAVLGSAAVAALISVLGGVLTKMVVDARLNRELEALKSDLSVWTVFRNETIRQMWAAPGRLPALPEHGLCDRIGQGAGR